MLSKKEYLDLILRTRGAELISFEYYSKVFGNFNVVVKVGEQLHNFITDKGEIYHDSQMICDNSYHKPGCDDTFLKLVDVIQKELFES